MSTGTIKFNVKLSTDNVFVNYEVIEHTVNISTLEISTTTKNSLI